MEEQERIRFQIHCLLQVERQLDSEPKIAAEELRISERHLSNCRHGSLCELARTFSSRLNS